MSRTTSRRRFIGSLVATPVAAASWARLAWAAPGRGEARLALVILRGGLDGLAMIAPHGDPDYERARAGLALPGPAHRDGLRDLDGFFGLHPACAHLAELYARAELLPVHAVASPYRQRSHFDAQNVLESGLATPRQSRDGWLNRALPAGLAPKGAGATRRAVALGQSVPLVLQGSNPVASWAPDPLPEPDDDTLARLAALYAQDGFLGPRFEAALEADRMAGQAAEGRGRGVPRFAALAGVAGQFLAARDGARIAVLESSGWDTHANQGQLGGSLARRLDELDAGIEALGAALGPAWRHTVVLVVTEFGRTVAMNGTRGTDHGTAGIALLAGGGVRGGRVLADWPGLGRARLLDQRDLRATIDVRSLAKAVLVEHLLVERRTVERAIFPGSADVPVARDLLHG